MAVDINILCEVTAEFDGADLNVTVELGGGDGTFEHDLLTEESRSKSDQHPISAITNLTENLQDLLDYAQAAEQHAESNNNPHPADTTQEFTDTKINSLATEATYTPAVWNYLVGLFTTVPKSVKEHLIKIWTSLNSVAFVEPVTETETFTLALTHLYKGLRCNSAIDIDCNIPLNDTVGFPIGSVITIQQIGNGVVTVKAVSGVTLNGDAKTAGQYKFIQLWKTDTDVWNIIGGVS